MAKVRRRVPSLGEGADTADAADEATPPHGLAATPFDATSGSKTVFAAGAPVSAPFQAAIARLRRGG